MSPSRLEIVRAEDRHAEELAEFIRVVWTPDATAASVLASRALEARHNVAEPGVSPPTWVALQAGKVIGHVTTIPIRLWDGERDRPAYWIKGLMVHPDFRNGPIGFLVLKAAVAALPCSGALAVAAPALRLLTALGYTDLGAIKNWVRPLALNRLLHRVDVAGLGVGGTPSWTEAALNIGRKTGLAAVLGSMGGLFLRGSAAAFRFPARSLAAEPLPSAPSSAALDALWREASPGFPAGVVRNAAYLLHRFPVGEASPYLWVGTRRGEHLAGVAILRRPRPEGDPRLRGIRVATLADVLYRPADPVPGLALLGGIERLARSLDADALLASCPTPMVQSLLRRQGYLPIAGNVHFLLRDVSETGPRPPGVLADWWLMRGDGQADEVF